MEKIYGYNQTPLDVMKFCRLLIEELQPLATPKHQLIFQGCLPYLHATLDEKILRHLLTNLIANAIKYSPNGGEVILEVFCQSQQLIFRIEDQGIGIFPEDQQKFQQFERGSNVGGISGMGLGLCILKQVVDLHGGEITLDSNLGVGTIFTVKLPYDA